MERILGIDLGTNSIGWSVVEKEKEGNGKIIKSGVRIFEAGMDNMEQGGRGESRCVKRRDARQRRRQLNRHKRRLRRLLNKLLSLGLLPEKEIKSGNDIDEMFKNIDINYKSPYLLRRKALDEKLERIELGRVLYHIAQRRGFYSIRKSLETKEKETGIIKEEIKQISEEMNKGNFRTLGEYFADKWEKNERIRGFHTSRDMYENEFNKILDKQTQFYPDILNEKNIKELRNIIFRQRPLKSQKGLVGECSLEKGKKRSALALLESQRFRCIQKVNDLRLMNQNTFEARELDSIEREKLLKLLDEKGDRTFKQIRKALDISNEWIFTIEKSGEKKMIGNRTNAKMIKTLKSTWKDQTESNKNKIIHDMRSISKDWVLKKRAINHYGFTEDEAEQLIKISLEDGYINFSSAAIKKLLPELEKGKALQTCIKEIYKQDIDKAEPLELLPPLSSGLLPEIKNPVVTRSLTQLRIITNSIIKKYGKPDIIRMELARDVKNNSKKRADILQRNRKNEKARDDAKDFLKNELNIENPSRNDIEKILLWNESNHQCPYTGESISIHELFGAHPKYDIEHIIPFSRSLDNSFINKTLCKSEENRSIKRNKTPYEAYSGNSDKWNAILSRVKRFNSDAAYAKLRRFMLNDEEVKKTFEEFSSRHLNDTRYASKYAKKYLGLLYGGVNDDGIDASGKRRVQTVSGQITALIRNSYDLNGILSSSEKKSRDDHRHHAVDSIVVALTGNNMIKQLTSKAQYFDMSRMNIPIEEPWECFKSDVEQSIDAINISRMVKKRVRGALHEESFYDKPKFDKDGKEFHHIRKRIEDVTPKNYENIVDKSIREAVINKAKEFDNPQKAFADDDNKPLITNGNNQIKIKSVRLHKNLNTFSIGKDNEQRHVQSDRNHHIELFSFGDGKGNEKWDGKVISMYEAYQRKRKREPIICKDYNDGGKFLFSLALGEIIELQNNDSSELYRITIINSMNNQIFFCPLLDARLYSKMSKVGLTGYPETLRKRQCRKVIITPIGDIRYAND